jgi:Xaa-Pro dipeptidase
MGASFAEHLESVIGTVEAALVQCERAGCGFDGVVLYAGGEQHYHADDLAIAFRPTPHFARIAPIDGPEHLVLVRPGTRPRVLRVVPRDYWLDAPAPADPDVAEALAIETVESPGEARAALAGVERCAFVGADATTAARLGIAVDATEPAPLMAALDWSRGIKTDYEIECVRKAVRVAAKGHAAARAALPARPSERDLHRAYLEASAQLEGETPYPNIVAWDRAAAVLHHAVRSGERPDPGNVCLIDAGGRHRGYASDITRTYALASAPSLFREILSGMERLQDELVAAVAPHLSFIDLHERALRGVCELLASLEVVLVSAEDAYERGIGTAFMPHGLGHHLGLQVHDVGGQLRDARGELRAPPVATPTLRTTRELAARQIVTIEPGLYFIDMLTEPLRHGPDKEVIDWRSIDLLAACGGIRIEDDVLVTDDGHENLSRAAVPVCGSVA